MTANLRAILPWRIYSPELCGRGVSVSSVSVEDVAKYLHFAFRRLDPATEPHCLGEAASTADLGYHTAITLQGIPNRHRIRQYYYYTTHIIQRQQPRKHPPPLVRARPKRGLHLVGMRTCDGEHQEAEKQSVNVDLFRPSAVRARAAFYHRLVQQFCMYHLPMNLWILTVY